MEFTKLNEDNFVFYAANSYYKPKQHDIEDFYEDLKRFKYLKRLINRYYESKNSPERLIINHLIVIFNCFGIPASLKMLEFRFDDEQWTTLKPFLLHLKYIKENEYMDVKLDWSVIEALRKM